MKIYTKNGDSGKTSLIGGKLVNKNDAQINAYGNIDELISVIGMLKNYDISEDIKDQLLLIQNKLFIIGTSLAIPIEEESNLVNVSTIIQKEDIEFLENNIDKMTEILPEIKNFIIPEGSIIISWCHIARTVCRRTERSIFELKSNYKFINNGAIFVNRLSDYFFILGRKFASENNIEENYFENE
ncbi:MAG: cob(I)yrinic acid a,c-diamide adenosyltransferase [Bacteroidales bacterium]|jgi:cob(I)alamin adenosyltransferase|nr:cob(I)yrinic acid a,c-diamide adenosyltransferase [Bacteroidales bacterium]